jgi:hypothetical protein
LGVRTIIPIFFLAGGEIVLMVVGLRVALWIARGWREFRAQERPTPPRGPKGGLRCLAGGAERPAAASPLRAAA